MIWWESILLDDLINTFISSDTYMCICMNMNYSLSKSMLLNPILSAWNATPLDPHFSSSTSQKASPITLPKVATYATLSTSYLFHCTQFNLQFSYLAVPTVYYLIPIPRSKLP